MVHCALANVRSMRGKGNLIADFIVNNKVHVMFITESWLRDNDAADVVVSREACPSPDYDFLNFPRPVRRGRGGGIAVIFLRSLNIKPLSVAQPTKFTCFELALFQMSINSKTVTFAIIYRPPNTSLHVFMNELFSLCTYLNQYTEVLLLGDFNLSFSCSDALNQHLNSILVSFDLQQHITVPTHIQGNILDLLFTRKSSHLVSSTDVRNGLSDHLSVFFTLRTLCPPVVKRTILTRKIRAIDDTTFSADITEFVVKPILQLVIAASHPHSSSHNPPLSTSFLPLSSLPSLTDPTHSLCEALVIHYNSSLRALLEKHAPLHTMRLSDRRLLPWWSTDVVVARRILRKSERRWRTSNLAVDRLVYIDRMREYHKVIDNAKHMWIKDLITRSHNDPGSMWREVNRALGRLPTTVLPDHHSSVILATTFNDYFFTKVSNLRATTISNIVTIQPSASSSGSAPRLPPVTLMDSWTTASEAEIMHVLRTSPRKSCCLDPLPSQLIFAHLPSILPAITAIVNCALIEGLPVSLKHAHVAPRLKKSGNDRQALSNYRPVSNLTFLSKVIERVVSRRLTKHLTEEGIWDPQQFAYRPHHSCETAMVLLLDKVYTTMDNQQVTLLMLLDLSAAFDMVDHKLLLDILSSSGITGTALSWCASFLSPRWQAVVIEGVPSNERQLLCGVPQGSVLGPIFFTIYMLGLSDVIRPFGVNFILYADDIQIYISSSVADLPSTTQRMEACFLAIRDWLLTRHLVLNESKTEVILLGTKQMLHKCSLSQIQLGTHSIPINSSVRDLGLLIDSPLTFDHHVSKICATAFMNLRIIGRLRNALPRRNRVETVHALVLSHFDFCLPALNGISEKQLHKLQQVLRAAMRVALGLRKFDSVSSSLNEHQWLSIHNRLLYRTASLVYTVLQHNSPTGLASLLTPYEPTRTLRSQEQRLLSVPRTNTTVATRAFSVFAPSIWNSLPVTIRDSASVSLFQSRLMTHLLAQQDDALSV
jgi:hypothetical protein